MDATTVETPTSDVENVENVDVENVENVEAVEAVSNIPDAIEFESLKKLKSLKKNQVGLYPLAKIKRGTNIRKKVKTDGLLESISSNGVKQPLIINEDGILIDGYRRFKTAYEVGLLEIPVLVIDIPEAEIPLYQYITMQREDISESERSLAVHHYVRLNPKVPQFEIVKKFGVSHETVSRIFKINNMPDSNLSEAISTGVITPSTGWNILTQASEENLSDVELILADKIDDFLNDETLETPKPLSLKNINSELVKQSKKPVPSPSGLLTEKTSKNKECLFSLINTLNAEVTGDIVTLTGAITKELWDEVSKLIEQSKAYTVTRITLREVEDELETYEKYAKEGEVFIQTENGYVSFNTNLEEDLGLTVTVENSLAKVIVPKENLEKILKKINSNVTVINLTKYDVVVEKVERRGRKKKVVESTIPEVDTKEILDEIREDMLKQLENTISTNEVVPEAINTKENDTIEEEEKTEVDDEEALMKSLIIGIETDDFLNDGLTDEVDEEDLGF